MGRGATNSRHPCFERWRSVILTYSLTSCTNPSLQICYAAGPTTSLCRPSTESSIAPASRAKACRSSLALPMTPRTFLNFPLLSRIDTHSNLSTLQHHGLAWVRGPGCEARLPAHFSWGGNSFLNLLDP